MQQRGKKGNTDDLLAASFKELLCKAPMEKITIKDITDKAGVIRPTFYNHFADKYALLEYIVRHDLLEPIKPLLLNDMIQEGLTLLFQACRMSALFMSGRCVSMDRTLLRVLRVAKCRSFC